MSLSNYDESQLNKKKEQKRIVDVPNAAYNINIVAKGGWARCHTWFEACVWFTKQMVLALRHCYKFNGRTLWWWIIVIEYVITVNLIALFVFKANNNKLKQWKVHHFWLNLTRKTFRSSETIEQFRFHLNCKDSI